MANIKVKDLTTTSTINVSNELMVLTDINSNTVQNITLQDFITSLLSTDNNNALTAGSDYKLYVQNLINQIGNLANLTSSDKTSLVNAINSVITDAGDLNDLQTAIKTSLVEAINEIAAIAEPTLQYSTMNNSKCMETGSQSNDAIFVANVKNYAMSSYDDDDLTFISTSLTSVTVTTDGTASGFTSTSYITAGSFPADATSFYVSCKFTTGNDIINTYVPISIGGAKRTIELFIWSLCLNGYYSNGASTEGLFSSLYEVHKNTEYLVEVIYNNSTLTIKANGSTVTTINDYYPDAGTINIGRSCTGGNPYNSNIDLKGFTVIVDGKTLVSGNKTGMDIIKPNNYTVNGTPTVSTDGIASGFSSGNIITTTLNENLNSNFSILFDLKTGTSVSNIGILSFNDVGLAIDNLFRYKNTSNSVQAKNLNLVANTTYHFDIKVIGNNLTVTINGNLFWDVSDYKNVALNTLYLGTQRYNPDFLTSGSIDLNSLKIYVDGDLVYQPCLKVPYTLTANGKYGSKIVDAYYLSRVKDVFEQNYPQKYYVLDRINNTVCLPMGDIYGMINQNLTKSVFLPDYANAITISANYTAPTDGFINVQTIYIGANTILYINNNIIAAFNPGGEGLTGFYCHGGLFPIKKGQVFHSSAYDAQKIFQFIPSLKGV